MKLALLPTGAAFSVVLALSISSCASSPEPVRSGREGLFQRFGRLDSKKLEREPADKEDEDRPAATPAPIPLRWPLKSVEVTSAFGQRGSEFHEGIDLRAHVGTPVYAAQSGVVIYSGSKIRGYGKMIVLRHTNGWATVYAHNSKLLAKVGQRVKMGQKLAISGRSGKTRGPHVHFEVRNGTSPLDPIRYLPDVRVAQFEQQKVKAKTKRDKKPAARVVAQKR